MSVLLLLALSGDPVLKADFDDGKTAGWTFTDESAWQVVDEEGHGKVLALVKKKSDHQPKVRSPLNIALAPDVQVADFVMDVKLKSTEPDYGHRDLCLFFGYRDPSHFYYVHIAREADPHANSVFLVDGAPRVSIATNRTDGTKWDDRWHHVRIERDAKKGSIAVFFDDMTEPIMTATDTTFGKGRVGVGSFDDRGLFDDIVVTGK